VWGQRGCGADGQEGAKVGKGRSASGGGGARVGLAGHGGQGCGGAGGQVGSEQVCSVTAVVVPEGAGPTHPLVRRARAAGVASVTPSFLLEALLGRRRPTIEEGALRWAED
jgi:hypothetical protein